VRVLLKTQCGGFGVGHGLASVFACGLRAVIGRKQLVVAVFLKVVMDIFCNHRRFVVQCVAVTSKFEGLLSRWPIVVWPVRFGFGHSFPANVAKVAGVSCHFYGVYREYATISRRFTPGTAFLEPQTAVFLGWQHGFV
jgi:hypothetical protein